MMVNVYYVQFVSKFSQLFMLFMHFLYMKVFEPDKDFGVQ